MPLFFRGRERPENGHCPSAPSAHDQNRRRIVHQGQRQIVLEGLRQIAHAKTPNNPAGPGRSLRPTQASLHWPRSIRWGRDTGHADAGSAGRSVRQPGVRDPLQVWLSMMLLAQYYSLLLLRFFVSRPDALSSRSRPRAAPLTPRSRGTLHMGRVESG